MEFCTQCGNSIDAGANFCGKCGSTIKGKGENQDSLPASTNRDTNSPETGGHNLPRKKQKYNMKIIGIAIAIALIIGFYAITPKQLTEQEYEDLVIELLVKDNLAMDNFSNEIEYSGVYIGMEPDWSEDYKQLMKPAKNLENDFRDLSKTLEKVKPPIYFEYEHQTLLKVFNAHQNMASNIVSYLANGDDEYMEASEEYEDRADDYLDESIFLTDAYEEKIMRAYQNTRME